MWEAYGVAASGKSQPTTVRLSLGVRRRLSLAVEVTRRSQSDLIEETLDRHLDDVIRAQPTASAEDRRATLARLMGAGSRAGGSRSIEEIDAEIRELRRDRT
jgi:predicted DNA-binding protein